MILWLKILGGEGNLKKDYKLQTVVLLEFLKNYDLFYKSVLPSFLSIHQYRVTPDYFREKWIIGISDTLVQFPCHYF